MTGTTQAFRLSLVRRHGFSSLSGFSSLIRQLQLAGLCNLFLAPHSQNWALWRTALQSTTLSHLCSLPRQLFSCTTCSAIDFLGSSQRWLSFCLSSRLFTRCASS